MKRGNTIPEKWYWIAVYKNGGLFFQFEDGKQNSFYDIEQGRLYKVILTDGERVIKMNFKEGRKLIIYTTRYGVIGGERHSIYTIGWQKGKTKMLFHVYEDGSVAIE